LIVNVMIAAAAQLLDVPACRPEAEEAIIRSAEKQLQLVMKGAEHWCAGAGPVGERSHGP
jgi:hypothetical protein